MLAILFLSMMANTSAYPIDGYRANLAELRVSMKFQVNYHHNCDPNITEELQKFVPGIKLAMEPDYVLEGRWDFDGVSEHYVNRLTGGKAFRPGKGGPISSNEILSAQQLFSHHNLNEENPILFVRPREAQGPVVFVGPFTWNTVHRFDHELEATPKFSSKLPKRGQASRQNFYTEFEVYGSNLGDSANLRELFYDPSIGFLPRYGRKIAWDFHAINEEKLAGISEYYLIEARPLPSGGFIPTEWFLVNRSIPDFRDRYPNYNEETLIGPSSNRPTVIHFVATDVAPLVGDVRLDQMVGVRQIFAPGGIVRQSTDFGPMTLDQLKSRIGSKTQPSNRPNLANIDVAEQLRFGSKPPTSNGKWIFISMIALCGSLIGYWTWRKRALVVLPIILITTLSGCNSRPVPRLEAAFVEPVKLFEPAAVSLKMPLMVTNEGNRTLTIYKIDAGCSCRQADRSQLPVTIEPGESIRLTIGMSGATSFQPQGFTFAFSTNMGLLSTQAKVFTLPKHHLSPDSITIAGLNEAVKPGEGTFELVHRAVFDSSPNDRIALNVPEGMTAERLATHEGEVANAPGLKYQDVTYRLTIQDHSIGLHRAEVGLRDADDRTILTIPVVWQRSPFLSSIPERLILSNRATRVFLKCPDETVDIARVVSAPAGVKAVQDSPRSVSVSLTDGTPDILDGIIEIETTAKERGSLKVPVVRYSPKPAG